MSCRKNEQHLDRLIHTLLEEELGGKNPPDLTDLIVIRARKARRQRYYRVSLCLGAAAAIALAFICVACWSILNQDYPEIKMNNVALLSGTSGTGAVYSASGKSGNLDLGGYCHITLTSGSTFKVEGAHNAEQIYLISGEAHCEVDKNKPRKDATFAVRTEVGVVRVTGTEFIVRILEKEEGEKMKRMMVKVIVGAVVVSGAWGNLAMSAEGVKEKVLPEKRAILKQESQEKEISPAMQKVLDKRLNVEFFDTEIEDAISYLKRISSTNIIYKKPALRKVAAISLLVREMQLENLLKWVTEIAGLKYEIREDAIYISDNKATGEKSDADGTKGTKPISKKKTAEDASVVNIRKRLKSKRITLEYTQNPLSDVIRQLSEVSKINIVLDGKVDRNAPITLNVKDMSLTKVLEWVTGLVDLRYEIRNEAVYISPKDNKGRTPGTPLLEKGSTKATHIDLHKKKSKPEKSKSANDDLW